MAGCIVDDLDHDRIFLIYVVVLNGVVVPFVQFLAVRL